MKFSSDAVNTEVCTGNQIEENCNLFSSDDVTIDSFKVVRKSLIDRTWKNLESAHTKKKFGTSKTKRRWLINSVWWSALSTWKLHVLWKIWNFISITVCYHAYTVYSYVQNMYFIQIRSTVKACYKGTGPDLIRMWWL